MSVTLEKGQKKVLVRRCLEELGLEATYGDGKRWFKKNHQLSLADATFYHIRAAMRKEAVNPKVSKLVEKLVDSYTLADAIPILKQAKELVDKIGKAEAKKVIDLL